MIETLGGMDAILAMPSFNHTPIDWAMCTIAKILNYTLIWLSHLR